MEKVPTVWFPVYEAQGNAGGLFEGGGVVSERHRVLGLIALLS